MGTKLNVWQVQQIIANYKRGHSLFQLAQKFAVHEDTVRKVLSGTHKFSKAILGGESILRARVELTPEQIAEIRELAAAGMSIRRLTRKYHVGYVLIRHICEGVPLASQKPMDEVGPNKKKRETIFSWAKNWEQQYDLRMKQG